MSRDESYPNEKVHTLICSGATATFLRKDWIDLAKAALDQAGLQPRDYDRIVKQIHEDEVVEVNGSLVSSTDDVGRYQDVTIGSVVQRFRWIEPGTFLMGSPESEAGRWSDEGPQHEVTLSAGYWMADTPVTQALWQAVMGKNHSRFSSTARAAEHPVEMVTWDDCKVFIGKLNAMVPGLDARLPTEAEWERACRGGTTTATYASNIDSIAWYWGNKPAGNDGTRPVRAKAANPFGLYDMLGNVWEWCEDISADYAAGPVTDPRGPSMGSFRVCRGGGWDCNAGNVRAAYRFALDPGFRYDDLGLRLARGHQV